MIDLSECSFLDSTTIGMLITLDRELAANGGRLAVVLPPSQNVVNRAFSLLRVREVLSVHDTLRGIATQPPGGARGDPARVAYAVSADAGRLDALGESSAGASDSQPVPPSRVIPRHRSPKSAHPGTDTSLYAARSSPHATHPPPATAGSHPVRPGGRVRRARRPVHALVRLRRRSLGLERLRRTRLHAVRPRLYRPAAPTSRPTASWRASAARRRSGRRGAGSGRRRPVRRSSAARSPIARACATRSSSRASRCAPTGDWADAPTLLAEQQTTALTDHVIALAGRLPPGRRLALRASRAWPGSSPTRGTTTSRSCAWTSRSRTRRRRPWPGSTAGACSTAPGTAATSARRSPIADGESGVGAVWLVSDGASRPSGTRRATGSQYQPGIAGAQAGLCLSAAALGDGVHAGAVGGADASGGAAATLPFTRAHRPHAARSRASSRRLPSRPTRGPPSSSTSATRRAASPRSRSRSTARRSPLELRRRARASGAPARGARLRRPHAGVVGGRRARATAATGARTSPCPTRRRRPSARRSRRTAHRSATGEVLSVTVAVSDDGSGVDPASLDLPARRRARRARLAADGVVHGVVGAPARGRRAPSRAAGRRPRGQRRASRLGRDRRRRAAPPAAGSTPAGGGAAARTPRRGAPAPPAQASRARAPPPCAPSSRASAAARPRVVIVRLRARPRLRIALRVRCGQIVRTLRVRANARGIATRAGRVRGRRDACGWRSRRAGARPHRRAPAAAPPAACVPQRRSAPTVARVSGRLAELRGRDARARGAHGDRVAPRRPRARRRLRQLRDLVRDRARRPVRAARAGARTGRRRERAVRAHDALSSGPSSRLAGPRPRSSTTLAAPCRRPGTASASSAPAASTAAPIQTAGTRPSTKPWPVSVLPWRAEHAREHGDAERAADLADRVVGAAGLALVAAADAREDHVRDRREDERHADAGEHERGDQAAVGDRRRGHAGEPAERDRLQREPGDHQRPAADAVGVERRRAARRTSASASTGSVRTPASKAE